MRECGNCTACCTQLNVPEYDAPVGVTCSNCKVIGADAGCTIHTTRHQVCRNFSCLWLMQEQIPDALRPDRSHVLFELPAGAKTYVGHIDPAFPDAYNEPGVRVLIQKITEAGNAVVLHLGAGRDRIYALPAGLTKEEVQHDIHLAILKHQEEGRIDGSASILN